MTLYFAKPRHSYDSYSDLWRLVDLAGFETCLIDEIDEASDNTYIFSTPSTFWFDGTEHRGWDSPRARLIFWCLEWYTDVDYSQIPGVQIWSPDSWWADRIGARYVPLGSHPDLVYEPLPASKPADYDYDVALLAYLNYRRSHVYGTLFEAEIKIAPGGWGKERHDQLISTRLMVHVHQQDDVPTVAPQRFALAAAYKLPLISESCTDWGIFRKVHVPHSVFEHLPRFTINWLRDGHSDSRLDDWAFSLHRLLCEEYTFRKVIEGAL